MSFAEKRAWIFAVVMALSYAIYIAIVLGRLSDAPVGEVHYAVPMLLCIGFTVVVTVVGAIIVAIAASGDANTEDERDDSIDRYGEHIGHVVLSVGAIGALGMALAEFEHFWVANTLFLAFVLDAEISTAAKLVVYRRSLQP